MAKELTKKVKDQMGKANAIKTTAGTIIFQFICLEKMSDLYSLS